jgi:hypothetical protein
MDISVNYMGVARLPNSIGGQCLACAKTFTSFGSAKRHYDLVHCASPSRIVSCHICGSTLKNAGFLKDHLRKVHAIYQSVAKNIVPQ